MVSNHNLQSTRLKRYPFPYDAFISLLNHNFSFGTILIIFILNLFTKTKLNTIRLLYGKSWSQKLQPTILKSHPFSFGTTIP